MSLNKSMHSFACQQCTLHVHVPERMSPDGVGVIKCICCKQSVVSSILFSFGSITDE